MEYKDGKPHTPRYDESQVLLPIESGIPIPEVGFGSSVLMRTARAMKVGDSITLQDYRTGVAGNMSKLTGFKFTQRKIGENMIRIWRTE